MGQEEKDKVILVPCRVCGKKYPIREKMKARFKFGLGYKCFCTYCGMWGKPKNGTKKEDIQ